MKKTNFWIIILIVIFFLGLRVYKLNYLVDTNGVDEGIQLMEGRSLHYGYKLYSQINSNAAPFFIGLYGLGNGNPYLFRSLSVLFSLIILFIVFYIANKYSNSSGGIIAGLLLTGEWFFLKESRLCSLDLYCATFICIGILFLLQYLKKSDIRFLCLSGLSFGFGAMTKLFAVVPFGIVFLYLAIISHKEPIRKWKFGFIYFISFLIPVLLTMFFFGFFDSFNGFFLNQLHRPRQALSYKLHMFNYYFQSNPMLIILAAVGIIYSWKYKSSRVITLWLLSLTFFFLFQATTWKHHLSLLSPPLAILAGIAGARLLNRKSGKYGRIFNMLLLILILSSMAYNLFIMGKAIYYKKLPVVYTIAQNVKKYTLPKDFIVSGDPLITVLANRKQPPEANNVAQLQYPPLTSQKLVNICRKYKVKVIILTYALLEEKMDFCQFVKENYKLVGKYRDFKLSRIYHTPEKWKAKLYFVYFKDNFTQR